MKPRQIIHGLCLLALSIGVAVAQDGERKGPPPGGEGGNRIAEYIKRADANSDGKISKEEFLSTAKSEAEERFSNADGNTDGFVDEAEIAKLGERMREGGNRRPGGAGGGSEGGFRRPPGSEGGDRPQGERPQGDRPQGDRPQGERPQGDRPPGGPGAGMQGPALDEIYSRMDKNSDGSVDKEEYAEFSKQEIEQRFTRIDGNADGKVSKEELKSGLERMRNFMRGPGGQGGPGGAGRPGGPGGGEGSGGGFRRPPGEGGERPRPEGERPRPESEAPKKDAA